MNMRRVGPLLPLVLSLVLVILFASALGHDPRVLPSALVGRPAPGFSAPVLTQPSSSLDIGSLRGQPWILHVWASWCEACRAEHRVVQELARGPLSVYGLTYKDDASQARAWLAGMGDPYRRTLVDADGRIGMDYGVYGVPETFVIDRHGIVRYRHAGPLTQEVLASRLRPLLGELSR